MLNDDGYEIWLMIMVNSTVNIGHQLGINHHHGLDIWLMHGYSMVNDDGYYMVNDGYIIIWLVVFRLPL